MSPTRVEVTNISRHGFWLWLSGRELFVSFERPGEDHLYWPDLDIDLSIRSIEHPAEFPLVASQR